MQDQVACRLCPHVASTLARHLKAVHGITADEYRRQYPDARIRSEACEANRRAAITRAHAEKPKAGLKKTVQCPSCGGSHEVGFTFAHTIHDARCDACQKRDKDAQTNLKWAESVEGQDYVTCQGCGLRAENLTSHVQSAHPEWVGCYPGQIVSDNSSIRDKSALVGRKHTPETIARMQASAGWNRGLTKETDDRVARAAEAMKGRVSWSKGLTKVDHPGLQSTSEKLSTLKTGVPNDAARLDLSTVDFTPYLDETGAVDRKLMSEELGISEPTVTKYMEQIGLRLSTKYVDARVARDVELGRFHDMSRAGNEPRTIRLTAEQLEPYKLKNGKIVLSRAILGLGYHQCVIRRECTRLGLPTFTSHIREAMCLDAVSKVFGGAPYEREWRSRKFLNPPSGHMFRFDGFFPSLNLIVEFHGYQHWTFPSVYIKADRRDLFDAQVERDREKERQVREDGTFKYLTLREDQPYTDPVYIRERYLDETE